jgi:alkaline phosphatase
MSSDVHVAAIFCADGTILGPPRPPRRRLPARHVPGRRRGAAVAGGDLSVKGGATRVDGDQSSAVREAIDGSHARIVILLIGDGMGDSEITSARHYQYGAAGRFPGIDALPLTGEEYTTFAQTRDGKPDYVTDPAVSGSGGPPARRPTTERSRSTSAGRSRT